LFGARPLNSVIRHYIKEPLSQVILRDKVEEGAKINFILENNEIKITTK